MNKAQSQQIPVIVLAGPTGVGKTDLSILLAKQLRGQVVNGDSMQVYRGLDIGTGKITPAEMEGVSHHLLDICSPEEEYNASQFKVDAHQAIVSIYQAGDIPIVVGGSGLYLEGLLYDLEFGENQSTDQNVRKRLEAEADQLGSVKMWERLAKLDPAAASSIPHQNVRRTIRALEVIEVTKKLFSAQKSHQQKQSVYQEYLFVLNRPRPDLYKRINRRVDMMVSRGLESEAEWLYCYSNGKNLPATKGIGYKEWWPYFEGQVSKEKVVEQIKQNSRRYAKRQLTWFRNRMKNPIWLNLSQKDMANQILKQALSHLDTRGEKKDD